ncbi:MAG: alanine--glyoxylate aminotransferase family protein [Gemmatimonadetes bacterium]|nr:alanine--glyoxylate aminotransferase family protein [Gemmatimonadota bacterium]
MRSSDFEARLLLGPGPSPVSSRIREALSRPTVGHLDPQFLALMDDVNVRLRKLFAAGEDALVFPISGTGSCAQEASLANLLEPGDTAVIGVNGVFGTRLAEMAKRMGARVVPVKAPWGSIIDPEAVLRAVKAEPDARLVALVHAETSTGVHQPLREVGDFLAGTDTLFVADTVTSLGGVPVDFAANRIDVAYSGTQKCLGVPPGLAPIAFSAKALERVRGRNRPAQSWYMDAALLADYVGEGSTRRYHHTAPINMMYALHESLLMVDEEGTEARFARHSEVGGLLQEELTERGWKLFAQEGARLPQLTSAELPDGRAEGPLREALLREHGIEVGGGLGPAAGKLWRIGTMGSGATRRNVELLLVAIDSLLG